MKINQIAEVFAHLRGDETVEVVLHLDTPMAKWAVEHGLNECSTPDNFIIGLLTLVMEGDPLECLKAYKVGQ